MDFGGLKDFKIPLLNQFSEVIDFSKKAPVEEKVITFDEAVKNVSDMVSSRLSTTMKISEEVLALKATSDGKYLAVAADKTLIIVNIEDKSKQSVVLGMTIKRLDLILNDKYALIQDSKGNELLVYSIPELEHIKSIKTKEDRNPFNHLAVSSDGSIMISIMKNNKILLWDLEDTSDCNEICTEKYVKPDISYDNKQAIFQRTKGIVLYQIGKSNIKLADKDIEGTIGYLYFAPSGEFIAVSIGHTIKILSPKDKLSELFFIPLLENITCMTILERDDIIVLGKSKELTLYDHRNNRQPVSMKLHSSGVKRLAIDRQLKYIHTVEFDNAQTISTVTFPQLSNYKKLKCSQILGFSPQGKLFLRYKNGVRLLNLKTNQEDLISKAEGINNVLFAGPNKVVVCHLANIMVINMQNQSNNTIEDNDMEAPTSLTANTTGTLLFAGYKRKIKVWNLEAINLKTEWDAHSDVVTSLILLKDDTILASASYDNSIKLWDHTNGTLTKTLKGHTSQVHSLQAAKDTNLLISSSSDKTIKIWNWDLEILVGTLNDNSDITGIHVTQDGKYLISASSSGNITYWSMKSFSRVFYNKAPGKIVKLYVSPDDSYLAYNLTTDENDANNGIGSCYAGENPLVSKDVIVSGPSENYYRYLQYLKCLITYTNIPEYDLEFDDWVILPYFLTVPHFYAMSDLRKHLKRSLANEFRMTETSFGSNILSIATEKEYRECRNVIIKSVVRNYKGNPFALACINKEVLVDMNNEGFRFLVKLYDLIFQRCQGYGLPSTCAETVNTPLIYHSNELIPYATNFFPPVVEGGVVLGANDQEKNIYFMHSLIPFNFTPGSQESLDFINSVLESPNEDIFRTKFIQSIFKDKWNFIKFYMYLQGIMFIVYMIALSIYVVFWQDSTLALLAPFILSGVLTSYEVYQAVSAPRYYFEDPWNYLDLMRATSVIVYGILFWSEAGDDAIATCLMVVQLLSWMRGITYFRLYPPTRYMINLLIEVVHDMISFLILLFYSTFSFAFIQLLLDPPEDRISLVNYFAGSYLLNLGEFDTEGLGLLKSIMFFIVSLINIIVMMNLLVSILGDTFDRVEENLEVTDYKELAEMILEIETLMVWNRNVKENKYFQMCLEETVGGEENWTGSVRELKVLIRAIKDTQLKSIASNVEENRNLKEHALRVKKLFDEEAKSMKAVLDQIKSEQIEAGKRLGLEIN